MARISCFRDRVLDEARPYVGGRVPASDGLRLGSVLELCPGLAQKPHAPTRRDPSSFFFLFLCGILGAAHACVYKLVLAFTIL